MKKDLKDVNYLFYNKFIRQLNREKIELTENIMYVDKINCVLTQIQSPVAIQNLTKLKL